jgi:cytochrome c oxidase assembly protein subunit 11
MSNAPANSRMLKKLAIIAVGMFGFGFALVPFYNAVCEASGINKGGEQELAKNTQVDTSRTIRVELDASLNGNMPWKFAPLQDVVEVHPGQLMQVEYKAVNDSDVPITGQAKYFKKIECFCFSKQVLQPHESKLMPVLFVIDPSLPKDVRTITLSYTFFNLNPGAQAAGVNGRASNG